MSANHSPVIGDKPIELLTNAERCDFGRGLIIFGRGLKILHARLIVTKFYIARASPVVKPFLRPCRISQFCCIIACCTVPNLYRTFATSQPSEVEIAEESAHSYTNIEFARESSQGTPRRMKGGFGNR